MRFSALNVRLSFDVQYKYKRRDKIITSQHAETNSGTTTGSKLAWEAKLIGYKWYFSATLQYDLEDK